MNYEKLLEKARNAYKNCATDAEKRRLESIFPELKEKESEDEKIAKELIRYLPYCNDIAKDTKERWIAWLEKQGEQKPADKIEPKFKVGDKIIEKDFNECDCGTIIDIKDGKYIFDNSGFIFIEEQGLWELALEAPEGMYKID